MNLATGVCPTCKEQMISANGVPKCFNCAKPERPKHVVKPPPVSAEEVSAEDLKGVGIKDVPKAVPKKEVIRTGTVEDALYIMKKLPMPDDIKQFKKIKKIIKQLEDLIGDK